ncbi:MAG: cytochrome b/b6 domain-containing protein [Bacteroidales bacterium]|nr:cytochrome b/b6 domain-containing protein [Bacteroidales bacterium]MCF8387384.1 cytochrome b/b6 domain-containing protein [Bacteroidales bacterium]MCF8399603.1 cytochrome b/b6 domain-containing protein [Bacteroidales bacterium]
MIKKEEYIYKWFERFWHWSQALLIFFLALTGFEVHGLYHLFGFENAVFLHDIAAWAFLVLIVFAIFWHFVTGEWKQYIPTTKYIKAQIAYYITGIFKGAPHPTHKTVYNKFNPLQRIIYLGLKLLVIPVMVITGIIYMYYTYPNNPIEISGLGLIAHIHTFGAFALMAFVVAHVYLTTTGETPLASIKAMITGWEVVTLDEKEAHKVHMQKAVDDSVAGYYRLDSKGFFVEVNDAWLSMYKYSNKSDVIGKHYSLTRKSEDLQELDHIFQSVMKGKSITSKPVKRKCSDGSTGKHLLSANPVTTEDAVIGIEGFILDLDETHEFSEHMYDAVRDSGAGYYRLDEQGIIRDVNEAWLKLYKYDKKEEVIGLPCSFLRPEGEVEEFNQIFRHVMQGETLSGKITMRKCKDGTLARHISSASPIVMGNKIVGVNGFILDLSELDVSTRV